MLVPVSVFLLNANGQENKHEVNVFISIAVILADRDHIKANIPRSGSLYQSVICTIIWAERFFN